MKLPALMLLVAPLVCACAPREAADIAATVNGKNISVGEFRQALAQASTATMSRSAPAALLDTMINRELFAQKAEKLKLDHAAPVALAIETARAHILAQAYLEHAMGGGVGSPREVDAFYRENPALFSQRRIYRIFELAVITPAGKVPALRERVARAATLWEVAQWLKAEKLPFNAGGATKPAEHIAPALLRELAGMTDGQLAVIEAPGGASIVQLVQSESAPLSREQAAPLVEEVLLARKRAAVAEREVKFLRSKASIEYVVDLRAQIAPRPGSTSPPIAGRPGT